LKYFPLLVPRFGTKLSGEPEFDRFDLVASTPRDRVTKTAISKPVRNVGKVRVKVRVKVMVKVKVRLTL
jgi:hypothetical protein